MWIPVHAHVDVFQLKEDKKAERYEISFKASGAPMAVRCDYFNGSYLFEDVGSSCLEHVTTGGGGMGGCLRQRSRSRARHGDVHHGV